MLVLQDEENSRNWLYNYANIFNTIELYSLKRLRWEILCHVYFTIILKAEKIFKRTNSLKKKKMTQL